MQPGRACQQFASFTDLAPTFLQAAGIPQESTRMPPIQGKSLFDFFDDNVVGRDSVLTGRERNDMCRPNCRGDPVRSLHKGDFVYMHNFVPERWASGTEESGFRDTHWGPTKSDILNHHRDSTAFALCFGKRPTVELYNVVADPDCMKNLAEDPRFDERRASMKRALFAELKKQGDPRINAARRSFSKRGIV